MPQERGALESLIHRAQGIVRIYEEFPFECQQNKYTLTPPRTADIQIPEWLTLEFETPQASIESWSSASFVIEMSNRSIWNLPLSLLMNIKPPTQSRTNPCVWTIPLSMDVFLRGDGIRLLNMQCSEIKYSLSCQGITQIPSSIKLGCLNTFLQTQVRQDLSARREQNNPIFQIESHTETASEPQINYQFTLPFTGCSFGYFISEASNITNFTCCVNGHALFSYSGTMLKHIGEWMGNTVFIPFLPNWRIHSPPGNLFSMDTLPYVNQDRVTMSVRLEFQEPQTKVRVHSFLATFLRYFQGMTDVGFGSGRISASTSTSFVFPEGDESEEEHDWTPENRPLNHEKNAECPISMVSLANRDYALCYICHHQFEIEAIQRHLSQDRRCPICRGHWTNYNRYSDR
jgi:hypothetical protein